MDCSYRTLGWGGGVGYQTVLDFGFSNLCETGTLEVTPNSKPETRYPDPSMWIEINSPHSGRPVRVRDKDIGRSVRDEDGRIFFVLPRTTGEGYYASVTRTGGANDEQKYLEMLAKEIQAQATGREITQQQIFDATGRKRSSWRGKLVILVLLLLVLLLVYLFTVGPFGGEKFPWRKPPVVDPAAQPEKAPGS